MEVQGLLTIFENQLEMTKTNNEKIGKQALDQIFSQTSPNEEFKARFTKAFNDYIHKIQAPWGAEEIVDAWADAYGKHFTDEELDLLVKFYTSPIGQKDVNASKLAVNEFTLHFQKLGEPIFQKATQEYIDELKLTLLQCNCKKTVEKAPDGLKNVQQ